MEKDTALTNEVRDDGYGRKQYREGNDQSKAKTKRRQERLPGNHVISDGKMVTKKPLKPRSGPIITRGRTGCGGNECDSRVLQTNRKGKQRMCRSVMDGQRSSVAGTQDLSSHRGKKRKGRP